MICVIVLENEMWIGSEVSTFGASLVSNDLFDDLYVPHYGFNKRVPPWN